MLSPLVGAAVRLRLAITRILTRLGFRDDAFLFVLAALIGVIAAAAAVGFHLLIDLIRDTLYQGVGGTQLYGRRLFLLIAFPAAGGLAVGLISRYVFRIREGQGIVDVLEAVIRSRGVIRPLSALEKIITSAMTIGTGGSAGAEGPIVQIGAGIASGVGQLFRMARPHLPLLIGCGSAAGISAIFNSPIGGVFFTLEVILLDFSLRTVGPVLLASVIANVTTKAMLGRYEAIFRLPVSELMSHAELSWRLMANFMLLGLLCGVVGMALTRLMHWSEAAFARMHRVAAPLRPAMGGALVGVMGVLYVMTFGWWMLGHPKPVEFDQYPLPAFFSDGYGVVRELVESAPVEEEPEGEVLLPAAPAVTPPTLGPSPDPGDVQGFYSEYSRGKLLALLGVLCVLKLLATPATLASGGSGGIIAPSLFLGATAGGFLGVIFQIAGGHTPPNLYALVGMGAVLAAVVHAPLASVLILLDLTQDHKIILPAMLASLVAVGLARLLFRDSIYTLSLRRRGVRVGTSADLTLLRRLAVEQVDLEPVTSVTMLATFREVLGLAEKTGAAHFVVVDREGQYAGLVVADDLRMALMQPGAAELLTVADLARTDVPVVAAADDLAATLDVFSAHQVDRLPVVVDRASGKVIGLVSRAALMRCYQQSLAQ